MARRAKGPGQDSDRLISGRLRGKAGRSGAAVATICVDGTDYTWSYRHGRTVWGKGIKAVSISAALRPERTRELILDFTVTVVDGPPAEARVLRAVESGIRSALEAGWQPESRGRAFRYEIAEPV